MKLGGRARGGRGGQVDEVRGVGQGGAHLPPPPAHRRAEASAAERQHTSCLERNETLSFDISKNKILLAFDLAFYDGAFKRTYPPPIN